MTFSKKLQSYTTEKHFFFLVLFVDCFMVSTIRFYPTMDGPSHLYNSNILVNLVLHPSSNLHQFFALNTIPVPNWISHLALSILSILCPAWLAEKIFILSYIIGLSLSFRLLIQQLSSEKTGLSLLIFPFAHSFLFHSGFYNYAVSFIFLFLTLWYWLKHHQNLKSKKYFVLFFLLTLTYFSAIITYAVTGCLLGLFTIADHFRNRHLNKLGKDLFLLFLISLPTLICAVLFSRSMPETQAAVAIPTDDIPIIKWITEIRCLIVFDYGGEAKLTSILFYLMLIMALVTGYKRTSVKSVLTNSDMLLPAILGSLLLLLIVPDDAGAGMMSARFCHLFFLLLICWLAAQSFHKYLTVAFVLVVIGIHFGLVFKRHNGNLRTLNQKAVDITNAAQCMEENSIVLPVYLDDRWSEKHFSNYLGIKKPLIILENYEASVGWFPVKWNMANMPSLELQQYSRLNKISWPTNPNAVNKSQVNYVCVYGDSKKINLPGWIDLHFILTKQAELIYHSADEYVAVYRVYTPH